MRAREVTRDGSLVAGKWEERVCKVCELVGQVVEACTNGWGGKAIERRGSSQECAAVPVRGGARLGQYWVATWSGK
jgi:hypothetical protein